MVKGLMVDADVEGVLLLLLFSLADFVGSRSWVLFRGFGGELVLIVLEDLKLLLYF